MPRVDRWTHDYRRGIRYKWKGAWREGEMDRGGGGSGRDGLEVEY